MGVVGDVVACIKTGRWVNGVLALSRLSHFGSVGLVVVDGYICILIWSARLSQVRFPLTGSLGRLVPSVVLWSMGCS